MRFNLPILTVATFVVLAVFAAVATETSAAQIVLRATAQVSGPIVRLADVADVASTDANEKFQLESIELFPVPSQGQKRYVQQRELQDLLTLSGVSLARHRFSGSSNVAVYGEVEKADKRGLVPVTSSLGRRAKEKAERAILDHIKDMAAPQKPEPWKVDVQLDDAKTQAVLTPGTRILVVDAEKIEVGTCRFLLEIRSFNRESKQIEVDVLFSLPSSIVVAARRLPRGIILQPSDVALDYNTTTSRQVEGFYSIGDVVGKELKQAVGEGSVIPADMVIAPIVVRKGEVVTVVSRSAGIAVSTNARAKENGGVGELIPVESLENREIYFAKITGLRELEVMAGQVEVQPVRQVADRRYERREGQERPAYRSRRQNYR